MNRLFRLLIFTPILFLSKGCNVYILTPNYARRRTESIPVTCHGYRLIVFDPRLATLDIVEVVTISKKTVHLVLLVFSSTETIDSV